MCKTEKNFRPKCLIFKKKLKIIKTYELEMIKYQILIAGPCTKQAEEEWNVVFIVLFSF